MKKEEKVYSFWNGKNLNGKQEIPDVKENPASSIELGCVVATETVSADELM